LKKQWHLLAIRKDDPPIGETIQIRPVSLSNQNALQMASDGIPRDYRPTVKVILAGNSGVGKTCLIGAYVKNTFEIRPAQTVAPAYSCREVRKQDGTIVILQIWDTAGQERYSSISQLFFRDSNVALVCFDPTDESSVGGVREWAKRILSESADCHLFGVLTKTDLIESGEIENVIGQAKVALADVNLERFFATSSVTRNGIDAVFEAAAELYTKKGRHLTPGQRPSAGAGAGGCC
jgi:small GTP-binding protein